MIEEGSGNLLAADVEALVNTVNTVGIMGKGVASQFKRAYPANFTAYRSACERGDAKIGSMFVYDTSSMGYAQYIINFPTKGHWKNRSRLVDIEAGLEDFVRVVMERRISSVAVPALGCGNGGLNWTDVRPLIVKACERIPDVRVVLFPPAGAPAAVAMPNRTPRPALTVLRALLLVSIDRYLERARTQEARDGVSELEIQKLAYLLQAAGAPLGLVFARGRYGPYSNGLTHVLDLLEGHFLVGLGDRSARVTELAPINVAAGSSTEASRFLDGVGHDRAGVEHLLTLVDGFEAPYSLELLATVHFAAHQDPATAQPRELSQRVADWNLRKARLFTDQHVRVAARRLAQHRMLPG